MDNHRRRGQRLPEPPCGSQSLSKPNLFERHGKWYARVQVNGKDVRRSLRTADPRIAKQRLKAILEQAEDSRAGIAPPVTHLWEDAVKRWAGIQMGDLRPATQTRYQTSLGQLHPHFAGRDIAGITTSDVHAYTAARMKGGTSSATVRRDLTVMSRVMRVARRAGWIVANPVPDEMEEITERREAIRPVPLRLLAKLTRRAPPGFCDLIRFLARTGCRQEEAASLEWPEVKLDAAPPTCTFARTKTRSPRVIELSPQTVRDLRRIGRGSNSPYVFRSPRGDRYQNVAGRFRILARQAAGGQGRPPTVARRAAGYKPPKQAQPFRCHDLRHTYAIRALQRGRPIYQLARHLGHSTVKTTETYAAWLARRPE